MVDLRLLIIADDPLARAGLAALFADRSGVSVIGQINGSDFNATLDVYRPDVALWDVGWESSSESLTILRGELEHSEESSLDLPVIVLIPDDAGLAHEVWAAGPRGMLARNVSSDRLIAALDAAAHGLIVLDPALAGALLPAAPRVDEAHFASDGLTARELEVLRLLAEGLPNKSIARQLGISEHTVKFHINAVMGKLGAQSRTDAVVRATRRGLIIL